MPEEFQPYFYLSHKDTTVAKPGKIIGLFLIVVFFVLLLLKLIGRLQISWAALGLIFLFAIFSVFIGGLIKKDKNKANEEEEPQTREPKDPPQITEEGHSL